MPQPKTRQLLTRCAERRDDPSWEALEERFGAALRAGVHKALRRASIRASPADFEDLMQEVYCRLLERGGRVLRACRGRDDRAAGVYLRTVAESVVMDRLRVRLAEKRGRDLVVPLASAAAESAVPAIADPRPNVERLLLERERRGRALSRLRRMLGGRTGRRDLTVLYLAYCEGRTSLEISRRLGGSLTATRVDALVHRLRRRLGRRGVRLPRRG